MTAGIGRLVRLANHLGRIVHPGEGLVGGHHDEQVGEGADGIVGAPSGVLLLVNDMTKVQKTRAVMLMNFFFSPSPYFSLGVISRNG